ncbi:unnamed protein product [Rhizoctonia solani]|uniref:F-box domain-containing protein n=1 Tax=Rhizoctonia solani TaxID=456999 RepID=A0A8H3HH93_9AGAM|nr:unnamed protein product [Rhizoctonia solani]
MKSNRNTRAVTTIYSLPPEILIGIFSLVVLGQHCLIQSCRGSPSLALKRKDIQGPDSLSQVCSLWHRIVMDFPSLWSHIDIALNHPLNPRLVARAKAFATRAGCTPLKVHIFDPDFQRKQGARHFLLRHQGRSSPTAPQIEPNTLQDFSFISSFPVQIQSLDFNFVLRKGLRSCHMSSLEYFLGRCTPGVLTHYSMQIHVGTLSSFIEPADDPHALESVLLDVPSQLFEDVFLGTTHLNLNNLCPHWGSTAYHGLVELRIGKEVPVIHEAELVSILRASPRLRVLQIRAAIEDPSPPGDFIIPVHLEDLEDLELNDRYELDFTPCGEILRWITPGSKPLQLTFDGHPSEGAILFCARANITRFFGEWFMHESISDMIHRSSQLEVLALSAAGCEIEDLDSILRPIDERNLVGVVPRTRVDTLYLVNFVVLPLEDLEATVIEYSVQRLVVRNCSILYRTDEGVKKTSDPLEIEMLLSTLNKCLSVEYLDRRCSLDLEGW